MYLTRAIKNRDIDTVREILKASDKPPLVIWPTTHIEIIQLLLNAQLNIDYSYGALLRYACRKDNYDTALFLLQKGANPNVMRGECMHYAILRRNIDMITLLCAYGAYPTEEIVARIQDRNILRLVLRKRKQPFNYNTVVIEAVKCGNDMVFFSFHTYSSYETRCECFSIACKQGNLKIAAHLEPEVRWNIQNILDAFYNGHYTIINLLWFKGKRVVSPEIVNVLRKFTQVGECCICCETGMLEMRCLECNHYYHTKCIQKWLKVSRSCPLCRNTEYW